MVYGISRLNATCRPTMTDLGHGLSSVPDVVEEDDDVPDLELRTGRAFHARRETMRRREEVEDDANADGIVVVLDNRRAAAAAAAAR